MYPTRTDASTAKPVVKLIGFLAGWLFTTCAFILGAHLFHFGPGLAFPYPYAAITLAICLTGHGIQRWIHS